MDSIFRKVAQGIDGLFGGEKHSHTHVGTGCADHHAAEHALNRYHSFQPESTGTPKWYVDGASYFWAVSESIESEFYCLATLGGKADAS